MTMKHFAYAALVGATTLVLAIGSATHGEAKTKKAKAKAAEPATIFCIQPAKPVCAERGGMKFTYNNACYARKDGAKVVSDGACKASKAMKGGKKKGSKKAMKKKK